MNFAAISAALPSTAVTTIDQEQERAAEDQLRLAAAATAWPADRPPAEALAFEPGRLTVSAQGWGPAQVDNFRSQLQSDGWQLDASEGKLTISRASAQGRR